jgi:3-phenylpropionate/cinnamic acid dioxygenase small subunit
MESARGQIENLMARYCRTFDEGDFAAYAELFRHGVVVSPWYTLETPEAIQAFHEQNTILYDGEPRTRHVVTNFEVEVDDGAGTATGQSYVTIYQALSDLPLQVIFVGGYVDRFTRIGETWHFAERRAVPYLFGDLSRSGRVSLEPGLPDATDDS